MNNFKKIFVIMLVPVLLLGLGSLQSIEAKKDYPAKPLHHIVPYPPGGDTDLTARAWANVAEKFLGQPVVVLNKAGGGGVAGTTFFAKSRPDGYTLMQGACGSNLVSPQVAKTEYDINSYGAVCRIAEYPAALVVHVDSPWKSLDDFIRDAKKNPGKLSVGSTGAVAWNTLVTKHWEMQAGLKLKYVHHQGSAPATTALLGRHVDIALLSPQNFVPQVKAGKVRLLVAGSHLKECPDVPTFSDLGYRGNYTSWSGVLAPKGTPLSIRKKLSDATQEVMKDPKFIQALKNLSATPSFMGPEEWQKSLEQQYKDLGMVIDEMGFRAK